VQVVQVELVLVEQLSMVPKASLAHLTIPVPSVAALDKDKDLVHLYLPDQVVLVVEVRHTEQVFLRPGRAVAEPLVKDVPAEADFIVPV
jgi:hypothetical protein